MVKMDWLVKDKEQTWPEKLQILVEEYSCCRLCSRERQVVNTPYPRKVF